MQKISIKFLDNMNYEQFESFQYLLDYDIDYFDIEEYVKEEKVIELDIDEEEDREDDIEVLKTLLAGFDNEGIKYELYGLDKE